MKRSRLVVGIILLVLFNTSLVWGALESAAVEDGTGDGIDYHVFYNDNIQIPAPLIFDAVEVAVTLHEPDLIFSISFSEPIPPGIPYSLQVAIDSDQDPVTGASMPDWYYNGLGVDHLLEYEFDGVESLGAVLEYQEGFWEETGAPAVIVDGATIMVNVGHALIGGSEGADFMVYVIEGIGLDMVPDVGKIPGSFVIIDGSEPEEPPIIIEPPTVNVTDYVFDYPAVVEEGTAFELDATANALDAALTYTYEWDLDGDGVFEVSSDSPIYSQVFPNDGEYPVTLKITDPTGLSGQVTETITVQNTPPYNVQITSPASINIDESLTLTATAQDKGDDQLTFIWDIDGINQIGESVTVTLTTPGEKTITLRVTDPEGATTEVGSVVTVNEPEPPDEEPEIDPLLIILVAFFGIVGIFIYNMIKPKKDEEKKKEEEDDDGPKDFCEEHPEIVEQEEKACWDAQFELDSAVGDVQDNLDAYRPQWQADIRDVSRTIMEWDIAYAVIQSLTKSEEEIRKEAETVQKIAGLVQTGGGIGKTAFKEGGEKAMQEVGKYMASEMGKNVAGGLSSTINDVLSLETWAYTEIGTGIAKLITGHDPRKEASNTRKKALRTINLLQSWVDHRMARTTRYTSRTLYTGLDECQQLLDALGKAMDDFENVIKGFRCVTCEIPDHILDEIDKMIKEIEDFMKTFGGLIDQVEQRLDQAAALLGRKDVYESPSTWSHAQNNEIPNIKESLRMSSEAKK